ncbi:MAG: DEAD/DEAH box helicase family protein [Candidatus Kapaibacterium sp.]|jgi:superfamily II DNA or RNA helicase
MIHAALDKEAKISIDGIKLRNGFRFRKGQEIFLTKLSAAFKNNEMNHLGVFVPGYGKTITALASFVVAHSLGIAKKLVVFVPRGNLRDQYADKHELQKLFSNIGAQSFSFCVADSERAFLKNISTDIIITTYQYASGKGGHKALLTFCESAPCMFVFDEVHHLSDDGLWAEKIKKFSHSCSISLSGTPMRADNKTLFGVPFDFRRNGEKIEQYYVALHEVSLRDAHTEGKILKRVQAHVIDYSIRLKNKETGETVVFSLEQMASLGDGNDIDVFLARKKLRFHEVYLESLLAPAFRRFDEIYARRKLQISTVESSGIRNHQLLVIAMSNKHAAAMLEFIRLYYPQFRSERIGQDVPEQERNMYLDDYRNGKIDVMVQVDMIGEGTDIKPISIIVKADLVRAHSKTLQQLFRGMRYYAPFGEKNNICDIFVAKDSGIVEILDWIASEEQQGIAIKQKRMLDEPRQAMPLTKPETKWELTEVEQHNMFTHNLQLFGEPQDTAIQGSAPSIINVAEREQQLRQECSQLASRLTTILRNSGKSLQISHIHAESKKRFGKPQELMSIPELLQKKAWLDRCLMARKIV